MVSLARVVATTVELSITCAHCPPPTACSHSCKLMWSANNKSKTQLDKAIAGVCVHQCTHTICQLNPPVVYRKKRLVGGRSKKARKVVEAVAALQAGLEDAFTEFVPKSMVSHCGATTCPTSTNSVHSGTTRHWQCSLF